MMQEIINAPECPNCDPALAVCPACWDSGFRGPRCWCTAAADTNQFETRCKRCGQPCKVEVVRGHYHDQGTERVSSCCRDLIELVHSSQQVRHDYRPSSDLPGSPCAFCWQYPDDHYDYAPEAQ